MPVRIDHIVIAVSNLAAAKESFRTLYGLEATGGGRHDGIGTENVIVPLDGTYLELVTVVDPALALENPFGRLVTVALERRTLLAAWSITVSAEEVAGLPRQHLTRDGVAVDLYGVEDVIGFGDRPFGLMRPAGQSRPGAGSGNVARLLAMHVVRPSSATPEPLTSEDAVIGERAEEGGGHLASLLLEQPNGTRVTLDRDAGAVFA